MSNQARTGVGPALTNKVMVYGASGHTGRFVTDELRRRGMSPILAGRSAARLAQTAAKDDLSDLREVDLADPDALAAALRDISVVINCAGPFLDTGLAIASACVRAGAHYLDVTAEQPAVAALYRRLHQPALDAGVAVIPAMAFFGGLADLMLTALVDGEDSVEDVEVAIGLDHWWPTAGTRITGSRNQAARQVIRRGRLTPLPSPPSRRLWPYPAPLGEQEVVELPFSEVMTIHRHLRVGNLRAYLNTAALEELRDPSTPPPSPADEAGRSAQRFAVDVTARVGGRERRLCATGRDVYALSAPIVVEGAVRLLEGDHLAGALSPGQAFDAPDVLATLGRVVDGLPLSDQAAPSLA